MVRMVGEMCQLLQFKLNVFYVSVELCFCLDTEGFISAEVLASNLEKAWLGLHIQVWNYFLLMVFYTSLVAMRSSTDSWCVIYLVKVVRFLDF